MSDLLFEPRLIDTGQVAFSYEVSQLPQDFVRDAVPRSMAWNDTLNFIGDYIVYPYGKNNDLPDIIREVVQNNYIAPGILKKKTQLIWGLGPQLYREKIEDRILIRDWIEDEAVSEWLHSWQYEDYLVKALTDYQHIEGVFSRYEMAKSTRLGEAYISKIVHIYPDRIRLASMKDSDSNDATHAITTDWSFNSVTALTNYKVYSLFDFSKPSNQRNSVIYSNMYSFCTDYYTVPDLYGSLEWIKRSTAVPLIFKALSKNSINLKYHIISPQAFWDKKADIIKENCTKSGQVYTDSLLLAYQKQFLEKISTVLSGDENTGKYLHTTKTFTVDGTNLIEHGWEIKVIDQNIKDYVTSQIAISERSDHALSAGLNLHSALGNVSESGKSDSGSEQIYALKTFLQTGIDIPEMIVMKAINYALKINFPNKKLKLGFYHQTPEKEQNISPKNRLINQ